MSFDIFYQTCRYGDEFVDVRDPETGKVESIRRNDNLNAAELAAVMDVLHRANASGPSENGCYHVEFEDRGYAEIFSDHLEGGCMVALRGMSPLLLQFLFDLLRAGRYVMIPAMEDTAAITTSPESVTGIPDDFPRIVVCNSVGELKEMLSRGFKDWQSYRNQILDRR
jgi:hypothetical protein